ncbi:MAG: class II aldolase/adducin family protein [Desulfurococcaceae archaeon]
MYDDLKRQIVDVFRYIEEKGWNHGRAGNISIYIRKENRVLITPSGVPKSKLKPEEILVLDAEGNVIEGVGKPTIELPMHLAIYKAYDYVNAIIHAHGIYSTTLAIAREPLPALIDEMIIYVGGDIRVAEYAPPGTSELAENIVKALEGRKAAIIANHGLIACGRDLEEATEILGLVERISQAYIFAKLLGKVNLLPKEIVELHGKTFISKLK